MEKLLHNILERNAEKYPHLLFIDGETFQLRYRDAFEIAHLWARALVASGVDVGDRVAVFSSNSPEYVLIYFAASLAGATLVPLNTRLSLEELEYVLQDSEPRIVFADAILYERLGNIRDRIGFINNWIILDQKGIEYPGWISIRNWVGSLDLTINLPRFDENTDVLQIYTSATTGHPKGAVITHKALLANIDQISSVLRLVPGDRTLVVAPLFHAGVVPGALVPISLASTLIVQNRFVPEDVIETLYKSKIAYVLMVPTMIRACLDYISHFDRPSFPELKFIYYGASPISEELLRDALLNFGCGFIQSYGLTEATQAVTFLTPEDHIRGLNNQPSLLRSAGRAAPQTTVRIVDSNGRDLPPRAAGEIVVRGPQLMRCYWKRPQDTFQALRDGWLYTGDIGMIDEEGYLYVLDRVKDMIISGGENVYSIVVENVISQHPDVKEVAVIGVPHPYWGESVHAVVVLKPNVPATAETAEKIFGFCLTRLASFEVPRSLEFVDQLPRNASGKVLKRLLRELAKPQFRLESISKSDVTKVN